MHQQQTALRVSECVGGVGLMDGCVILTYTQTCTLGTRRLAGRFVAEGRGLPPWRNVTGALGCASLSML